LYDITNDYTALFGTYPNVMSGTNIDIFDRINEGDTVTYVNLPEFIASVISSFSLGFSRYYRYGNDGERTLTQTQSEQVVNSVQKIFSRIEQNAGRVNVSVMKYIVAGETNDDELIGGQVKTIYQKVGPVMELLLTDSKGSALIVNEDGDQTNSSETGERPYISVLNNSVNPRIDLLTLFYKHSNKDAVLSDVLSNSHNSFTLNRINSVAVDGAIIFYYENSSTELIADQAEIFYSLGIHSISLVLTGIDDNNGTLDINTISDDIIRTQNRFASAVEKRVPSITDNIIRSLVRYNVKDKNYTNLFTWSDPFNMVSLKQAIGKVENSAPDDKRGFRMIVIDVTSNGNKTNCQLIYGVLPSIIPTEYSTNRENDNGDKVISFGDPKATFDIDITTVVFKSAGSNLEIGDMLYDINVVRSKPASITVLCSFDSSSTITLSLLNGELVIGVPIKIQLGDIDTNPVIDATIIKFVKYVDRNNYKQSIETNTFANITLDDASDYILEIKLPSNYDVPVEKYADYPRLGSIKIYNGALYVGNGLVTKLNSTTTL
jgi:transaldolase